MVDKQKKIWLDGEFIDWDEAKVHVLTHSLHYGLAAFDGMRAYQRSDGGTYVFRLREHVDRLFDSCKMCLLQPKFTREQIERVCVETLRVNGMVDGYLRPMVFIGEGAMGIYVPQNPVLTAVIAWRWGAYLGDEALKNGIRAKIGSFARHHINVSLSKAKMNGQYTNSVLAKREAKLGGYDEAILLDANGYVSEGSGENIFIARRGVLYTPDLSCSILEGVTRDTVITLAREMGISVVECRITRDQLWLADEVFLTGTAAEITPVREVDNRTIGQGTVGPITKQIQARFFDVVRGSDASHPEWLTRV
jgi:branched-chain amino acid aminotransferase